jgi:CHAT domain-containing protein
MLLLGDASVDEIGNDPASGSGRSVFTTRERLPGARQEVLGIATLARENKILPTIWLGSKANEDNFKSTDLSAFRFIHIATHAISDRQDGEASALTLGADPNGSQDGILTGDEIEELRLNSDLVVLSGCETGIGQATGAEGIVALNRTFLLAGARCVCGSLWQVEDSWTEKLMIAFYRRHIGERFSKTHSLRLAKLKLIEMGAHPSQWAPFILVGSSR